MQSKNAPGYWEIAYTTRHEDLEDHCGICRVFAGGINLIKMNLRSVEGNSQFCECDNVAYLINVKLRNMQNIQGYLLTEFL